MPTVEARAGIAAPGANAVSVVPFIFGVSISIAKNPASFREQGGRNFGFGYSRARCSPGSHVRTANRLLIRAKGLACTTDTASAWAAPAYLTESCLDIARRLYDKTAICQISVGWKF